jgi:deazaflavin-dependent oxidoreductase (nitroreductase family)
MAARHSPRFYRLVCALAVSRVITRLHPRVYRLTGGWWIVGRNLGVRNVIVETTGRRTGKVRHIPLYAFEDAARFVVIASNGGRGRPPAWLADVRADPGVHVRVGRERRAMRAYEAGGEERSRLWHLAATAYPGFDLYQEQTVYPIPVVVLEPHAPGRPPAET